MHKEGRTKRDAQRGTHKEGRTKRDAEVIHLQAVAVTSCVQAVGLMAARSFRR
jgi:hypothetical protein